MKKIILGIIMVIFISGCADKRLILVPQSSYMPTFPTQDFQKSEKYSLDMWEEQEDVNGTTIKYLVAEEKPMKGFIRNTKILRSNYNLLLRKLNEFNNNIKEQNRIQNEKKPQEVQSIKDSWFK